MTFMVLAMLLSNWNKICLASVIRKRRQKTEIINFNILFIMPSRNNFG